MGRPYPSPAMVPKPLSMPLLVISPKKSTPPTAPTPPTCCCAAYGPPSSPSPARLYLLRPGPLEELLPAVVNAYEKIRSMLAGAMPPPWSRMRKESVAGLLYVDCDMHRGGGTAVVRTCESSGSSWRSYG